MAIFDAEPGQLRSAATIALVRMGATIVMSDDDDPDITPIAAITEPGVWSIGERMTIRFGEHGSVLIESRSRQWLTLFDWFVNRRNVNRLEKLMRQQLEHPPKGRGTHADQR